jgi:hypothetical protein
MLLMLCTLLPLPLLWPIWQLYRRDRSALVGWRRLLFLAGMVVNAVSAAVLVVFTIHAYLISAGAKPVDLDWIYPVFSMLGLGLLAAALASCGRGASRVMLVANGVVTAVLWYLVGMAASP